MIFKDISVKTAKVLETEFWLILRTTNTPTGILEDNFIFISRVTMKSQASSRLSQMRKSPS